MKKLVLLASLIAIGLMLGCVSQNGATDSENKILFTDILTNEQSAQLNAFETVEYQILDDLEDACDLNEFKIIVFNGKTQIDPACLSQFKQNNGKVIVIQNSGLYETTDYYNNKIKNYPAAIQGFVDCLTPPGQSEVCSDESKEQINGQLIFQVSEHPIKEKENYQLNNLSVLAVQPGQFKAKSIAYIKNNSSPRTYIGIIENINGIYFNYDPFETPELLEKTFVYLANKS